MNVIATLNQGGVTADASVSVLTNPYAPGATVNLANQTGTGGDFQFVFNTGGDDPAPNGAITNAWLVFSSTAVSQGQVPSLTGCYMDLDPGYTTKSSTFELGTQTATLPAPNPNVPNPSWSVSALWNADCSVNLQGAGTTTYSWGTRAPRLLLRLAHSEYSSPVLQRGCRSYRDLGDVRDQCGQYQLIQPMDGNVHCYCADGDGEPRLRHIESVRANAAVRCAGVRNHIDPGRSLEPA